jgi:hypothetical protein
MYDACAALFYPTTIRGGVQEDKKIYNETKKISSATAVFLKIFLKFPDLRQVHQSQNSKGVKKTVKKTISALDKLMLLLGKQEKRLSQERANEKVHAANTSATSEPCEVPAQQVGTMPLACRQKNIKDQKAGFLKKIFFKFKAIFLKKIFFEFNTLLILKDKLAKTLKEKDHTLLQAFPHRGVFPQRDLVHHWLTPYALTTEECLRITQKTLVDEIEKRKPQESISTQSTL